MDRAVCVRAVTLSASTVEQLSWWATIVGFAVVVLSLVLYQAGVARPLAATATWRVGQELDGSLTTEVRALLQSRTRNTTTIRAAAVVDAPRLVVRVLWPWWWRGSYDATPFRSGTLDGFAEGLEVAGHDAKWLFGYLAGGGLPYGRRSYLQVEGPRRRPILTKIASAQAP